MKIFLTGVSGFVGTYLCRLLLEQGHYVYGLSRKKKSIFSRNKKFLLLNGKLNDNWSKQLRNSDILIHLASVGPETKRNKEIFETNVINSSRLLKNAIRNNLKKWLVISSSSEYGQRKKKKPYKFSINTNRLPNNAYGLSKAIFTDICIMLSKKHNCKVRIMRLFPLYGYGEKKKRLYPTILNSIKKNSSLFVNNPFETRDFTSIEYASKKLLTAINFEIKKFKLYQIWNISEGKTSTVINFIKKILKEKKSKIKLIFRKNSEITFNHISNKKSNWVY